MSDGCDVNINFYRKAFVEATTEQAFDELGPVFEDSAPGFFNMDTYASPCWKGSSTNRRNTKVNRGL